MGFYMEVIILGINTMYMLFCFFKLFLVGCTGLIERDSKADLLECLGQPLSLNVF